MTNLLIYGYYYRYKQARIGVKNLVTSDDFSNASTMLTNYVNEHDNYVTSRGIDVTTETFTANENKSLHHGFDHLQIASSDIIQKQATIDALNEV